MPAPRKSEVIPVQVEAASAHDRPRGAHHPRRPRDAATLILLDRGADGRPSVLMGKRHERHVFMPGQWVFPGGRTDAGDSRVPVARPLDPGEETRLMGTGARATAARARAIALSAIRETYEEAGLLIGRQGNFKTRSPQWRGFVDNGVQPSLETLRFVARAITPPGQVRRFDTRFLATWRDAVAFELPGGGLTDELLDLEWLPIDRAIAVDMPGITRIVLKELQLRLAADPELSPGAPVPFFAMRGKRFERRIL